MVRLIDCEVYAVESIDITRLGLLSFFCNNHTDELVVVYSQGRYEGVISYSYLLNCASDNIDDVIIKENIFVRPIMPVCSLTCRDNLKNVESR